MKHTEAAMRARSGWLVTLAAAALLVALSTALLIPGAAAAAGDSSLKCRQGVLKGAAKLAHVRLVSLRKCEDQKRAGKLPALPVCGEEPGVVAALAQATAKLATAVDRACGGDDRRCGGADDVPLAAMGWAGSCPDLEGAGCAGSVASCADVATCIACLAGAAVERDLALVYAPFAVADPSEQKALVRCRKAIATAAATLADKHAAVEARCLGQRLAGKHAEGCPLPGDGTAAKALAALRAAVESKVCKACGGPDRRCGGGDDLARELIGTADHCPGVGGCARPVTGIADLVACLDCAAAVRSECALAAAAPNAAPYPPACAVVPSTPTATPVVSPTPTVSATPTLTATPHPTPSPVFCPAAGVGTITTAVTLTLVTGTPIGGASLVLDYPPERVRLPGVVDDAAVRARVTDLTPVGALFGKGAPNNQDSDGDREPDRVRFTIVSTVGVTGAILRVTFDRCAAAPLAAATDFSCTIVGTPVRKDGVTPVVGASCTLGVVHAP